MKIAFVFLLNLCLIGAAVAQIASSTGIEPGADASSNPVAGSSSPTSFRINNKVYAGKEKNPVSQSVTMFYKGRVYDFMSNPDETIIFDPELQRFLIISALTKTQCAVTLDEVETFERMMKEAIPKVKDEFIKSCLSPEFEISQDPETDEWVYSAPRLTYRVKAQKEENPGDALRYAQFANKYALLNVILVPQSIPPFARIAVNNDLAQKRLIPGEITITLQAEVKPLSFNQGKETIRTTHVFVSGLGDYDMSKIRKAGENYGRFKQVSFTDYQKGLQNKLSPKK